MEIERQAQVKKIVLRGHPFDDEQELSMVTPEI